MKPGSIQKDTMMVIVNALYFNAPWKFKFVKTRTRRADFHPENKPQGSKAQKAWMMDLTEEFEFAVFPSFKSRMLRLPFKGDRIVLDILLPNQQYSYERRKAHKGSSFRFSLVRGYSPLSSLEKFLETTDIQSHFEKKKRLVKVHVRLPKFKIESTFGLNDVLKKAGMVEMFNKHTADFTGISKRTKGNLYVSEVGLTKTNKNFKII